jgi:hypothetical protein
VAITKGNKGKEEIRKFGAQTAHHGFFMAMVGKPAELKKKAVV